MERLYPETVITGCGNPLFADDGFGPAVVERLRAAPLPSSVKVIDAGLGGPHFVFTMLDPAQTRKLVVIDIADFGGEPGELRWFRVEELPAGSYRDIHSWDLTEPLQRIKDDIVIRILCCQKKHVSAPEMEIGLTEEVEQAVPKAVSLILEEIGVDNGTVAILQESTHGRRAGTGCETR